MSNTLLFQQEFNTYQKIAFLGQLGEQRGQVVIKVAVNTPASGTKPRPGYPLFYNSASKRFEVPRTALQVKRICGVVTYYKSDIMSDAGVVEYENDTMIDLVIRGSIWVGAGATISPTDRITWDIANKNWVVADEISVEAFAAAADNSVANVNAAIESLRSQVQTAIDARAYTQIGNYSPRDVNNGELFMAYLSGGIIT